MGLSLQTNGVHVCHLALPPPPVDAAPKCGAKYNCKGDAAPEHGTRSCKKVECEHKQTSKYSVSTTCEHVWLYECKDGFENTGTTRTTCPDNRHNSKRVPKCEPCAAGKSTEELDVQARMDG